MSAKRKYNLDDGDDNLQDIHVSNKKHTLDSDEDDSDEYEKDDLGDSDIEGEEDGVSKVQDEVKITPFNMREELEEGHFDKEGHYHWNKSDDIKDNWLDNIDWVKIEKEKQIAKDEDSTGEKSLEIYNETVLYKQLLSYMSEGETVSCSLRRLGKSRVKMSSVERLRMKKQGIKDENGDKITKLTELANEILTKTGNMDIYQATYESIKEKVSSFANTRKNGTLPEPCTDMYSDDFNEIKNEQIYRQNSKNIVCVEKDLKVETKTGELLWEFKWKENDTMLQGPFNTKQMLKWSKDGYFKSGVYVRQVGKQTNFYTSNRIDFDLYL